jgi:tetratricopeptide (TPR) repeat protein
VGGYFAWTKLYLAPLEEEAQGQMFMAERYFEKDSLNKAINGDGQFLGFKDIVDKYSLTPSGNLGHLYLGLCYLHTGKYEDAISELKEYDGDDLMLSPISIGAQGDALSELGKQDEAIENYLKAAEASKNNFTTPIYLMKAATLYESQAKFADAVKIYEQLKTDYPEAREGRDVEKYISRAKLKGGIE